MKKETAKTKNEAETAAPETDKEEKEIQVNQDKVGSMIHEARLKKGIKIADASKDLCIRSAYLEAIESSNYDEVPEAPYGIGFIRSYAEYLGLNSARMVQLFKEETDAASVKNNDYYVMEPQTEVTAPNRKYLMISLLAVFAVYFIWFVYNEKQNNAEEAPASVEEYSETFNNEPSVEFPLQVEDFASVEENNLTETAVPVEVVPVVDAAPVVDDASDNITVNEGSFVETKQVKEEGQPVQPSKSGSRVSVKVKGGDNWVEVKDGNKLYISKVLHDGDVYTVPAGKGMILSVGRAEGVEVTVDGKVTEVVKATKKTGIALDKFLDNANH